MADRSRIYTRKGDDGTTSTASGRRLPKNDPLIEIAGGIDECNAFLAAARSSDSSGGRIDSFLRRLQCDLMAAGADISSETERLLTRDNLDFLEGLIDELSAQLPTRDSLILPHPGKTAALLHLARTAARKVERQLLSQPNPGNHSMLQPYFNRLSDALFVIARTSARNDGIEEEKWSPGKKNPAP